MPCSSDGYPVLDDVSTLKRRVSNLTQMLCECLKAMDNREYKIPIRVASWWENHKEIDRKRLAREKAENDKARELQNKKIAALSKLSPEDRKVLGL